MIEIFCYILLYLFIGEIFSILNWFYFTDKTMKDEINFIIYLITSTCLWPAVIIGKFINFGKFIMKNYV